MRTPYPSTFVAIAVAWLPLARTLTGARILLQDELAASGLEPPSKCIPSADDVSMAMQRERAQGGNRSSASVKPKRLTFFLYETGAFNFSETIHCVESAVGMHPGEYDFDIRLNPSIAEHLTDLWALRAFQHHPQRVWDPAQADVKILGVVPYVSWMASKIGGDSSLAGPCGTLADHTARMEAAANALRVDPVFQKHAGRDFLIVNSHYRPEIELSPALEEVLQKGPAIVTTAEHAFMRNSKSLRKRTVVVPYVANFLLERAAAKSVYRLESSSGTDAAATRAITHIFHGTMNRRGSGSKRQLLADMATQWWPKADISNKQLAHGLPTVGEPVASTGLPDRTAATWKVVTKTADSMQNATLCLCPEGDTPTTRRPFDSLAAGCVPVFFNNLDEIAPELPFPNVVDWGALAIFAGSLSCLGKEGSKSIDAVARWLLQIATVRPEIVSSASKRGIRAFRDQLSYLSGAIVTSLLAEIEARFQWPPPLR